MMINLYHKLVLALKRAAFGAKGEPYEIPGHTLRYEPGTRPVRLKYAGSRNNNNRFDALQVQLFSSTLRDGDLAIDVGAHAGQYTLIMAAQCGEAGSVIAFEPDPHARNKLHHNLGLNPNIKRPTVVDIALSDHTGTAVLYSRGGNSQSSLARSGLGGVVSLDHEEIRVPLMRLDDYIEKNNLPTPRWVKIDAEGAEIRILRGAPNLMRSAAGIVCELHPYAWPEFGNTVAELKALAAAAGRRIRYMDEDAELGNSPVYGTVIMETAS